MEQMLHRRRPRAVTLLLAVAVFLAHAHQRRAADTRRLHVQKRLCRRISEGRLALEHSSRETVAGETAGPLPAEDGTSEMQGESLVMVVMQQEIQVPDDLRARVPGGFCAARVPVLRAGWQLPLGLLRLRGGCGGDLMEDGHPVEGAIHGNAAEEAAATTAARSGVGAERPDLGGSEAEFEALLTEFEAKVADLERRAGGNKEGSDDRSALQETREQLMKRLEVMFAGVDNEEELSKLLSRADFSQADPISVAEEMQRRQATAAKTPHAGAAQGGLAAARASAAAAARRQADAAGQVGDGGEPSTGMGDAAEPNAGQKRLLRECDQEFEASMHELLADENAEMITETLWLQKRHGLLPPYQVG